ncbi:elongation factor P [Blattabacterium sp. (Blattella germanica) str. Bge]|uniref:elongation factor P n=1 Tax=Blattabacterium sp. (Blattella germanica) TaxID=624186 RepID=UPI0001BB62C9|nr:elongation factor P [Blattabacterium sp. (Blattella germanica)]ACY40073.1 elongation factor P [Blattabacterium sp. (Blattella germanica) str. Bge]
MNIRKGLHIQWNKEVYKIIDFLHVKPGKGYAFVRTKLKNLVTGHVLENNFSAKHKLKEVKVESNFYRYLYKEKDFFYFMNEINCDQIQIEKKLIKNIEFLKEGMKITIFFHVKNEKEKIFLFLKIPSTVILKVKHTEFVKKGDTINNTNKIAVLETGTRLLVPSFIDIGEFVKINTEHRSYIERIRK